MLLLIPEACQYVSFEAPVHIDVRVVKVTVLFSFAHSSVAGQICCTDITGTSNLQQDTGTFLGKVN
jgi:hypothetical protein